VKGAQQGFVVVEFYGLSLVNWACGVGKRNHTLHRDRCTGYLITNQSRSNSYGPIRPVLPD
jgi:hypothetical protein